MAQFFMFVYILIIFLSSFLIEASTAATPCTSDKDCRLERYNVWCINGYCKYKFTPID
ncbi:late nodulin [Medicago truncatula]|uniref:Late nodulin n=2 Tax=Medicago truncatula TaxID=3880 RepID=G7L5K0_MEDTR|nr:late nodulin [Medicago truncatula]